MKLPESRDFNFTVEIVKTKDGTFHRLTYKCDVCKIRRSIGSGPNKVEDVLNQLPRIIGRPVCEKCDDAMKKYGVDKDKK